MSRRLGFALATLASLVTVPGIAQAGGWGGGWGTGCGCGGYSGYASVAVVPQVAYVPQVSYIPTVSYAAVAAPSVYVVNQGPVYSGYGLNTIPSYSTAAPLRRYPYHGGRRYFGPRYSSYRPHRHFHHGPRFHQEGKHLVPAGGPLPIDK